MQFGLDQDLPGHVGRVNVNPAIAWSNYSRPIRDVKLYIPPRLSEPQVTARYSKWWKKLVLGWSGVTERDTDGNNAFEDSKAEVKERLFEGKLEDDFDPPPPDNAAEVGLSGKSSSKCSKRKFEESSSWKTSDCNARIPPPKHSQMKASESEAKGTLAKEASEGRIDGVDMNTGVSPNQVQSSTAEATGLGLEERIRTVEKLCAWLEAGKLVCL
ncbi:UNVERIFIED_CONTAM: hypothetical protein Sradi_7221600 [Sesamum radiatum]|uniref:Aminotransferase-like plant mobile domain-containing protein n=1 Tax=Sesamum radiatum TaxID=300843 RepID=A0AAW2IP59_SESRA